MAENDDVDGIPLQLSSETLNALLEFYHEEEEVKKKLTGLKDGISFDFKEDWNMSQFWYAEDTAESLSDEALRLCKRGDFIACVSTPTIYLKLRKKEHNCSVRLFEYDTRFASFEEDFVYYDYNSPLSVPREFLGQFDVIIADPPYLSEECLSKTSTTIQFLAKQEAKIILCTGCVMEDLAASLLSVKKCAFVVRHNKALSNPFACFANYNLDEFCR